MKLRLPLEQRWTPEYQQRINGMIERAMDGISEYAVPPPGGSAGQVLTKLSERNYEFGWVTPSSLSTNWQMTVGQWHADSNGDPRFYFGPSGNTYYRSPVTAGGSVAHEFRNGSDAAVFGVRADGFLMLYTGIYNAYGAGQYFELAKNDTHTYGSMYLSGPKNGYTGLVLHHGAANPVFMTDGSAVGVWRQGSSYWSWCENGTHFRVYRPIIYNDTSAYIKHAGAYLSGNITVTTSAPSGGSDGDIWLQV